MLAPRIPKPALERLPVYLRVLRQSKAMGKQYMSSSQLGKESGVEEFQVRKDLSYVRAAGRPGRGYHIETLISTLEGHLGVQDVRKAVVVGAGRLGQALSLYPGFRDYGFQIVRLFDTQPTKIGQWVGGLQIASVDHMVDWIWNNRIPMAIITVPAEAAQPVADRLVRAGVRGMWNFAPVVLEVPDQVFVRNEDLAVGLASLSHHVADRLSSS